MPLELVPDICRRGERGDQIDLALMDSAISRILTLYLAIDNQSGNGKTFKGWIQHKLMDREPLDYREVSEIVDNIQKELGLIHADLTAARKGYQQQKEEQAKS